MSQWWSEFQGPVLLYGGRALATLVILAAGWLAVHFLISPLRRLLSHSRLEPAVVSFVTNTVRTGLIVLVIVGVLQQLGVETSSVVTLLSAAGLAVALSLQGSLANFASGLLVLSLRMVRIGDQVQVGDVRGQVTELLPFHVVLVTPDNQRITVPNTLLITGPVRNFSALPTRGVQWAMALRPEDDLAAVKEALRASLQAEPRILAQPPPHFFIQDWSEAKRTLAVEAWTATENWAAVQQEMLEVLGARLEQLRRGIPVQPVDSGRESV
jgi:small conductance mechanosensitive channel